MSVSFFSFFQDLMPRYQMVRPLRVLLPTNSEPVAGGGRHFYVMVHVIILTLILGTKTRFEGSLVFYISPKHPILLIEIFLIFMIYSSLSP